MEREIVLFSGGIDSAVCALQCNAKGLPPLLVTFDYGQTNAEKEIDFAQRFARDNAMMIEIVDLPIINRDDSPIYPGRNLLLISAAIPIAITNQVTRIIIGCNAADDEIFPDCRPEFLSSVNQALDAGGYGVQVDAPLLTHTKKGVIALGLNLGLDINKTWSCYTPTKHGMACGECLACTTRNQAIEDNA